MASKGKREIQEAIRKISGTHQQDTVEFIFANVDSINIDEETAYCTPVSGKSTTQISASLTPEVEDGILIIPAINSTVGILKMINQVPIVFFFNKIDGYSVTLQTAGGYISLTMNTDGTFQLNDGTHLGLVKVTELTSKLNTLESSLNDLKKFIQAWIPVPNDGGAALKGILSSWYSQQLILTQISDIENNNITHGEPK